MEFSCNLPSYGSRSGTGSRSGSGSRSGTGSRVPGFHPLMRKWNQFVGVIFMLIYLGLFTAYFTLSVQFQDNNSRLMNIYGRYHYESDVFSRYLGTLENYGLGFRNSVKELSFTGFDAVPVEEIDDVPAYRPLENKELFKTFWTFRALFRSEKDSYVYHLDLICGFTETEVKNAWLNAGESPENGDYFGPVSETMWMQYASICKNALHEFMGLGGNVNGLMGERERMNVPIRIGEFYSISEMILGTCAFCIVGSVICSLFGGMMCATAYHGYTNRDGRYIVRCCVSHSRLIEEIEEDRGEQFEDANDESLTILAENICCASLLKIILTIVFQVIIGHFLCCNCCNRCRGCINIQAQNPRVIPANVPTNTQYVCSNSTETSVEDVVIEIAQPATSATSATQH